jgi:hypothetical protein
MITKVGILIAMLSGDGYWFGGSTATAEFQWVVLQGAPDVRIDWDIAAGQVTVAKGRVELRGNDGVHPNSAIAPPQRAAASITVPEVRVPAEMLFHYRATSLREKSLVEENQSNVHVYPRDLLQSAAARLRYREIYLWDEPSGLPALLKQAHIAYTAFDDPQKLQFVRPDILIAAAGQVSRRPEGQAKLLNLAAAGTGVLVLRQADMQTLAGYRLVPRKMPDNFAMLNDHPLLRQLGLWRMQATETAWAIEVPVDAPVMPIAWWPQEPAAQSATAVDALMAVKPAGRGRIVLCQYPLGPWQSDPRSQLFLDDALDYLMSPVATAAPLAASR